MVQVDIWSGNHPFYQGTGDTFIEDDGRVDRFKKKFGDIDSFGTDFDLSDDEPIEE